METRVLDYGVVRLQDHMGGDKDIVDAARVSYDPHSTDHTRSDEGLIRYLYRHKHTTPFEMCELKFYLKMPIFVARQWIRHRTANINEYSGRYSVMKNEFHVPKVVRQQSLANKQGSEGQATISDLLVEDWHIRTGKQFHVYEDLIQNNVAREQARIHLPLSTYTELYWKIDLHNLFHFLKLRTDPHAQEEIRVYADAIEEMVSHLYPLAHKAWVDYSKEAYSLSRMEIRAIQNIMLEFLGHDDDAATRMAQVIMERADMTTREKGDLINLLGFVEG